MKKSIEAYDPSAAGIVRREIIPEPGIVTVTSYQVAAAGIATETRGTNENV